MASAPNHNGPEPNDPKHLDRLLSGWPYEFGEVVARLAAGADGREVVQLRIDLGMLQMEVSGRPDGWRPEGFETYYDFLLSAAFEDGESFTLGSEHCLEIDREFVQFYHRRIGWLALREFRRAVLDADHTLALMDFSSAHAPDPEWADLHEQYRPFVLFHRTQAAALAEIDDLDPESAVEAIDAGMLRVQQALSEQEVCEDEFEEDDLIQKLLELKRTLADHYELETPLKQQLDDAIAHEQYELAAKIRDRMANRQPHRKM
ncbi:MAG: UvrB/UvrC motif-containing protein [Planctomycetota bacterium]